MTENIDTSVSDADAEFLGWQKTLSGEIFPTYTLTASNHPSYHSTVNDLELRNMHLRVPRTPSPYPGRGPSPWQFLGIELNHPRTAREAVEMAGLDYTVTTKRLEVYDEWKKDAFATVRMDTGDVLGIVGKSYVPIQNRDAFAFFDLLVDELEAVYETAGVLGLGERIWILAKLPGYIKVHGNDIVNKYLLLINSHDGGVHVRAKVIPIRVVCDNTLTSTWQKQEDCRNRATQNAAEQMEQAVSLSRSTNSLYDKLGAIFNEMAAKNITGKQLQQYVEALVPDSEECEDKATTGKIRSDIIRLYNYGLGAELAHGSLWGAFNSATEYADHRMLDENMARRLNSIWFGRGEQFKLKAFHLAERMMYA